MTTRPIDDELLQRYLDGDLPEADADAVSAAIEADPALARRAARIDRLAHLLRENERSVEAAFGDAAASEALFGRIEADLDKPAERPGLRALPGGRTRRVIAGVTGALAMAAAVTLVVLGTRGGPTRPGPGPVATHTTPRGTEVLDVDFGKSTGTLFTVEGASGEKVTVVWIVDDVERTQ